MDKSLSISGHRLDKLESLSDSNSFLDSVRDILYIKINSYIDRGFNRFYVGMSDGIDLWAGQILLELKSCQYPQLEIVAVKPYPNHGNNFSKEDKALYNEILEEASLVVCTSEKSSKWCYLQRNQYMVDNSTNLLALVSDLHSGTGRTINYAKSLNRPVEVVDISKLYNRNATFKEERW